MSDSALPEDGLARPHSGHAEEGKKEREDCVSQSSLSSSSISSSGIVAVLVRRVSRSRVPLAAHEAVRSPEWRRRRPFRARAIQFKILPSFFVIYVFHVVN